MAKEGKIQLIKYAPPPPELPVLGKVDPKEVSFVGRTNYVAGLEEKRFIFGIKRGDRKRHVYVIGKSGVGKSKFLELLIRQDIAYQKGICVLDPHGDVVMNVLDCIPKERIDDVCVIDLADTEFFVSFNPFSHIHPTFRHQFAQGFIQIIKKQFDVHWTHYVEHVLRFSLLALLDYPDATVMGLISILNDESYRMRVIPHIQDAMVKKFWSTDFPNWMQKYEQEAVIPLVNKLGQFLSNPILRNIFIQKENKIDFESLMNGGKIVLINLARERLGDENANFLGSLFIEKIRQAGMMRTSIPEWAKNDFYVYIDEFQGLVTETFENLLFESKKYGICITISHQYMGQLSHKTQAAIIGNVGAIIVFRVSGEDAERLEIEMMPIFKAKDMINLGVQEFYIKMTIDGETHDPFSADTLKVLPFPEPSQKDTIIQISRNRFMITRSEAEAMI